VFGQGAENRGEADGVVLHRTGVTLASRPLQAPKGVAPNQVAVANYKSLSLRTVYAYNHNKKQDEISVDLLYGLKATRADGVVLLELGIGS
jgi:P22 coat protein - gene protein 5